MARPPADDPSDIKHGDWVERWLPRWAEPYARLARWDRPIGTWLLLFPGWWGIALAGPLWPDPILLLLFAPGVALRVDRITASVPVALGNSQPLVLPRCFVEVVRAR